MRGVRDEEKWKGFPPYMETKMDVSRQNGLYC